MLENDYVNLYLNTGYGFSSPTGLITLFLLAMMRILPILSFAPYLGAKLLPRPVKVGLGLAMFAIFFPMLLTVSPSNLTYNSFTWVLVVKEVFIGTLMGILTTVPSFIVQGAGMFIDHQRGGASLQVQDPTMQNQASPIGTLYDLIYIFLFWLVDGPFILIETIHHSFEVVPPDKLLNPAFFTADSPFWLNVVELFNHIMKLIVQLASPSLIIILMTDTFLGIANRLAPNVMITFLGMPLKSFLGIFIIFLGWKLLCSQMIKEGWAWQLTLKEYVELLGIGKT